MITEELRNEFYEMEREALKNLTSEDIQEMNDNIIEGKETIKKLTVRKYVSFAFILFLAIAGTSTFILSSPIMGCIAIGASIALFIFDFIKTLSRIEIEGHIVGMLIQDKETYLNM